jgi:hypothetical protein
MHNQVFAAGESSVMVINSDQERERSLPGGVGVSFQSRLPTSKSAKLSKALEARACDRHSLPKRNSTLVIEGIVHPAKPESSLPESQQPLTATTIRTIAQSLFLLYPANQSNSPHAPQDPHINVSYFRIWKQNKTLR